MMELDERVFFRSGGTRKTSKNTTVTVTFGFSAANSQRGRVSLPGGMFIVVLYRFVFNHRYVYPEGSKTIG